MLTDILVNIGVLLALLFFFGISIFIHEFGHYIVARWCGLVVEVFSIGFGPAIWKKTVNGVVYKIGIFPVGGYVALPQLDPTGMSAIQGEADGGQDGKKAAAKPLPPIEPWKKILVSVAGAVGNIILAVALAWVVYLVGMPAGPAERSAVIGYADPACEAYQKGLRTGDRITRVNQIEVKKWTDFRLESALYSGNVEVEAAASDGTVKVVSLATSKGMLGEQTVDGLREPTLCVIMAVEPGMSAAKAGLKPNDMITHFAGEELHSREHMFSLVSQNKGLRLPITIERFAEGKWQTIETFVTPDYDPKEDIVRIGIRWNSSAVDHDTVIHPKPMEQVTEHATAIFRFLGALVQPAQAKAASAAVGGPVAIMASYWFIVKTSLMLAIWFTGFLNVNLAMLNLLPIPVLDGGHICFSIYEWVARRPVPARLVHGLVNGFAMLLIGVIVLLSVRDVDRFTPLGGMVRGIFDSETTVPAVSNQLDEATAPAPAE